MMIVYSILCFIVGFGCLWFIWRFPKERFTRVGIPETFGAWVSGLMFILMGMMILWRYLHPS